jgi:amidophosphoribosyltransferase
MSDSIKHECAVSLLRLRQKPDYYLRKYGSPFYGFQMLTLLLEKQHNRGQDGAGMAGINLHPASGRPGFQLERSVQNMPLADLVARIGRDLAEPANRSNSPFAGELFLGHLRYGTYGNRELCACQPLVRENAFLNRTLLLAGNFNLTNTGDILQSLIQSGHHVPSLQDSSLILQIVSHYLEKARAERNDAWNPASVLAEAVGGFDGAFTLCGALGNGEAFALRDPAGIRPGFFYYDDEIIVVSSERAAIQTVFDRTSAEVMELPPGEALLISQDGKVQFRPCLKPAPLRRCVFERIYFSRGNDAGIHQERKALGHALAPAIVEAVDSDWENSFFSYIPNTAQISFHGMLDALWEMHPARVRFGQIAIKDAKFRTFIADENTRKELAMHVYDVTYGLIRPGSDNLVVIDDSIVRGNTMRNAILPMLDRLNPKRIVIASSAPPIRYPDCYGIDMGSLRELIAFEAAIDLLNQRNQLKLLESCYHAAKTQLMHPDRPMTNCVAPIYESISDADLVDAIAERLRPSGLRAELKVIFQTCEDLTKCCPEHSGDWYFTGNYPTPGGFRVVNQALVNYVEKNNSRAYQE